MSFDGRADMARPVSFRRFEQFAILVGFSLYLVCGVLSSDPSLVVLPVYDQDVDTLLSMLGSVSRLTVLVVVALASLHKDLSRSRATVIACGAAYAAGILLSYSPEWLGAQYDALLVVGELLRAFHIALFVLWCQVLCRHANGQVLLMTAGAYCVSFALKALFADLSLPVLLTAISVLPLLSSAVLCLFCEDEESGADTSSHMSPSGVLHSVRRLPLRQFFGIGIFGLVLPLVSGAVKTASGANTTSTQLMPEADVQVIALVLVAIIGLFALVLLRMPEHQRDLVVYRLTMPLVVLALIVVYAVDVQVIPRAITLQCAWVLYRTMATVAWCAYSRQFSQPSGFTLAVSQVVLTICLLPADSLAKLMVTWGVPTFTVVGVAILVVTLASAFLVSENDYRLLETDEQAEQGASDGKPDAEAQKDNPSLMAERAAAAFGLSHQEQTVCELICEGKTTEQIIGQLFIAKSTLKVHLRNIYRKMDVHSRDELVERLRGK